MRPLGPTTEEEAEEEARLKMILSDEQLAEKKRRYENHEISYLDCDDIFDTIANLQRQLAERDAPRVCTCNSHTPGFHDPKCATQRPRPSALDAYVQERVDAALRRAADNAFQNLKGSIDSFAKNVAYESVVAVCEHERLAANRARVREGK